MSLSPHQRHFLKIVRDLTTGTGGVTLAEIQKHFGDGATDMFLKLKDLGYLERGREVGHAHLTRAALRALG